MKTVNVHDIRSVIQQLATAFDALKTIGLIHADLKLNNVMVVDSEAQPLRVKFIDFGLAVLTSSVKQGKCHQIPFRAPEIALGLPFSEAIDMWSLGVVIARMVLGEPIFPGRGEYNAVWGTVKLPGVPPAHLLSAGMYSRCHFVEMPFGCWRLKFPLNRLRWKLMKRWSAFITC
ncbi:homeodomain-interacting protein kinase 2-like [Cebidichthys violaceus]|uniref:homeodomain-interacting protein kinase 2-like n=1 Tax=Cebidichthys violaceus TaxID=271503 RepID=UPI0035CBD63D